MPKLVTRAAALTLMPALIFAASVPADARDGRVPQLNVQALCKARSAGDRLMQLPESQSVADCVRDETDAKQKLSTAWSATSGAVRGRCKGEAAALGTRSYVDLLTCIQMAADVKPASPATASKDTRKHRARK